MKISKGFTFIELMVVVSIIFALSTISLISFNNYQSRRLLELSVKEVRQMFEEARSRTVTSVNDSVHGVHLTADSVILFQGEHYDSDDGDNTVFVIDPRLTISEVSFSPVTNTVVFEKGTGEASAEGFIEILLVNKPEEMRRISISKQGIINSNE